MRLHLVRHAKTDPTALSGMDFDRKLLPKGIIQTNVLAYHLNQTKVKPAITFCSDAVRTRETLSILRNSLDLGKIQLKKELYLADRESLLQLIWRLKHNQEVMIIGHNDGISQLASYLIDDQISLKTCGYVCVEFSADSWKEVSCGTGRLIDSFRPSVHFPD